MADYQAEGEECLIGFPLKHELYVMCIHAARAQNRFH